MSLRKEGPPDPMLVLRTFGRIAISDAVTIVLLSVLYSIASLSIITIGPALLALMDAFHASITHTGTGGGAPDSAIGRASHFVESIWTYIWSGLPYTVAIIAMGVWMYFYLRFVIGDSVPLMLIGVLGLYVIVAGIVLLFRAADIVVREDAENRPGFFQGLRLAWRSLASNVPYAAMHAIIAIVVTVVPLLVLSPIVLVVALPGLLALLELLNYEELDGAGAKTIRFAYLDPQE